MTDTGLIARVIDIDAALVALGAEEFQAAGGTFRRDRSVPDIYDANHVVRPTVSSERELDALLARMEVEYQGFGHRRIDVDFRTHPLVAPRLALEGYTRDDALIMLLEGPLGGPPPPAHDIRPITAEAQWEQMAALKRQDWVEHQTRRGRDLDMPACEQMVRQHRAKAPAVQYFLAYVDGEPAAFFSSWPGPSTHSTGSARAGLRAGPDGIGQVEDLFTLPEHRKKGLATALLHHCVAHCRARGARSIIIAADPADTPKHLYARLGWRPVAILSHWLRKLPPDGSGASV